MRESAPAGKDAAEIFFVHVVKKIVPHEVFDLFFHIF